MSSREDYLWDPSHEPDPDIVRIEQALRPYRHPAVPLPLGRRIGGTGRRRLRLLLLSAAASVALACIGAWTAWRFSQQDPWTVETLAGAPRIDAGRGTPGGRLGAGARVETDARSSARIAVGRLGVADVAPGSRVEVLRDDQGEHRLALRYGTIHATIWARPRFFVVETRAATAVDLGCVYSIRVDSSGAGILAVSYGEVELQALGRRSVVAAGTAAMIVPGHGPGLPYPVTSSDAFRGAVVAIDTAGHIDNALLDVVLRGADAQGTVTLWHMLPRVVLAQRARVYERLAAITPPPAGVARDAVLALDSVALARWEAVLRPRWSSEPSSRWRRFLVRVGLAKPAALLRMRETVATAKY